MSTIVEIEELGRRIRKLRMERRMTLKQVETGSGLSATHLSEIERGRTSPTIGALVRIARALDKDASYFIEREERSDVAHVSGHVAGAITLPGGAKAESLTPGIPGSRVFAYRVRLSAGSKTPFSLPASPEALDAIYFVRAGNVATKFGDTETRLEEGDAVQASMAVPHELAADTGDAELLLMTTRPLSDQA